MTVNTGKIQGKHREFNLNLNVATLNISKSPKSRALQDISKLSHFKPKSLNTAQVFSPNPS